MQFSKQLPVADLALGLSIMIGLRFRSVESMDAIRHELLQCTHETLFAKADAIAARYGRAFKVEEKTYAQIEDDGVDCFLMGSTPMGDLCGTYIDAHVMLPTFAHGYPQPHTMQVFTTYLMTKH